jgi:hypothetical protein
MTSCVACCRPSGSELYKQRAQLIEPIFGTTNHNRGFVRFHRRGRSAVRTEWRLMATTHNPAKAPPALHRRHVAQWSAAVGDMICR